MSVLAVALMSLKRPMTGDHGGLLTPDGGVARAGTTNAAARATMAVPLATRTRVRWCFICSSCWLVGRSRLTGAAVSRTRVSKPACSCAGAWRTAGRVVERGRRVAGAWRPWSAVADWGDVVHRLGE